MVFDANGRQLCGDPPDTAYLQAQARSGGEGDARQAGSRSGIASQQYLAGDTDVDLGPFKPPFRPADRVAAMTHAYWTFVDRYDLTPPDIAERPS